MAYIGQSYIGQVPTTFGSLDKQSLNESYGPAGYQATSIDGVTSSFWLSRTTNSPNSLLVNLDGVILNPGVDYRIVTPAGGGGVKIQFIGPVDQTHPNNGDGYGLYPPSALSTCYVLYLGSQFFTGIANSGIVGLTAGTNIALTSVNNPNGTLTYTINSSGGTLATLSDTQNLGAAVSGQALVFNGSKWIAGSGFANGPADSGTNNYLSNSITLYGTNAMGLSTTNHGAYSVAIGKEALYYNQSTCVNNVGVGYQALYSTPTTTSQGNNVAIGYQSLYAITTGANNTAIGKDSGKSITTGSNNVILGSYTGTGTPISLTGSGYVVLSDGAGNVRQSTDATGATTIYGTLKVNDGIEPKIAYRNQSIANAVFASWFSTSIDMIDVNVTFSSGYTQLNIPADSTSVLTIKNGKHLTFRFTSTSQNTSGSIVFTTSTDGAFRAVGTASPTITLDTGQTLYIGCIWNSTSSRWDIIAQAQGGN